MNNNKKNEFFGNRNLNRERSSRKNFVSITYEELGLFPRSFSKVFDRFLKQIFSDVDILVIQEYRFYRYLFFTTIKCILTIVFVPLLVNFFAKNYLIRPLTKYLWNAKQTEIFLNRYQQKQAFSEIKDFEEKLYFESLTPPPIDDNLSNEIPKTSNLIPFKINDFFKILNIEKKILRKEKNQDSNVATNESLTKKPFQRVGTLGIFLLENDLLNDQIVKRQISPGLTQQEVSPIWRNLLTQLEVSPIWRNLENKKNSLINKINNQKKFYNKIDNLKFFLKKNDLIKTKVALNNSSRNSIWNLKKEKLNIHQRKKIINFSKFKKVWQKFYRIPSPFWGNLPYKKNFRRDNYNKTIFFKTPWRKQENRSLKNFSKSPIKQILQSWFFNLTIKKQELLTKLQIFGNNNTSINPTKLIKIEKNNISTFQEKTMELAIRYNNQSIEAITNLCSDLLTFFTFLYLVFTLEIQINITKSFLLEIFFGLDDSKKSLLILLVTDLLVGYHSSNIWELFFEFIFNHYGFAESHTGIFLLVATLPVLLDVLFKYLIFRHLNRSSPTTVATYHAMIE